MNDYDLNHVDKFLVDKRSATNSPTEEEEKKLYNDPDRQVDIVNWLSTSVLSKQLKNGKGFYINRGSFVRLISADRSVDILEWLFLEGIKGCDQLIGDYIVVYYEQSGRYKEKLTFYINVAYPPFKINIIDKDIEDLF